MYLPVAGVDVHPLVPPAIGLGVGVLSGLFGVGGGFLVTPLLIWIGVPPAPAVASDLNQMVASSSSAAVPNAFRGNVSVRLGLLVAAGALPAGLAGVFGVSALIEAGSFGFVLGAVYVVLLAVIGVRMTLEFRAPKRSDPPADIGGAAPREVSRTRMGLAALALGLAAGGLSAFLGVGGGIILLPALIYLLGVATRRAVGTSLFQVSCIAFGTTVFHAAVNGTVDVVLASLLMLGSVPGARAGVWLSYRLKARSLKGVFGVLVLLVAAGTAWKTFFGASSGPAGAALPPEDMGRFCTFIRSFSEGRPLLYGLAAATFALVVGGAWGLLTCRRKGRE